MPHLTALQISAVVVFAIVALGIIAASVLNYLSLQKTEVPIVSGQRKPRWQKLQWANAERDRLEGEVRKWRDMYESATAAPEITEEYRKSVDEQNRLLELGRSIDGVLNPLQVDAVRLSSALLDFLKRLGPPPMPKYTAEDIDNMNSAQMKVLIEAQDGEFLEACEYYRPGGIAFTRQALENQLTVRWTRLLPWYQKVEASYALEFKGKVDTLRHRFAVEGITDNVLLRPIEGKDGEQHIRAIAAAFWELAYKVGEKDRSNEDTRIQGRPKRIEEL
jgi:hypothetical protein